MLRATRIVALAVGMQLISLSSAYAQRVAVSTDDVNAHDGSLLDRPANVSLDDVELGAALRKLAKRSGVVIAFSASLLPPGRVVSCTCEHATVGTALERLLSGTRLLYRELQAEIAIIPRVDASPTRPRYASLTSVPVLAPIPSERLHATEAVWQADTITGRVTDAATGQGLRWANVRVEGTSQSTTTDLEGRYRLEDVAAGTYTLTASILGYSARTLTVEVTAEETVAADFALEVSALRMDELVVTATGEQRRRELGHVVGSIDAETVARDAPITQLTDLIGARVAGLQVIGNTGLTGESPRIRVRGIGSFSGSRDPLLYVDGVRVESGSSDAQGVEQYGVRAGRLNDLNPDEIESIEVVKGPSAATLYGTDAANGVILVRTKRGQPGRTRWDVYFEAGGNKPAGSFSNTDSYYSWGTNAAGHPLRCMLLQIAAGVCAQDSLTVFNPFTDSETSPIGAGTRMQAGAQVSGGAAQLTYFLSGDFEQETGYLRMPDPEVARIRDERGGVDLPDWQVRPNALKRLSLRGSLSANIGENADVRVSTGLVSGQTRIPNATIFLAGYLAPGHRDANDGWQTLAGLYGRPGEVFATKSNEELSRYTASVTANWRPISWLRTRAAVGTDVSSLLYDGLQRRDEGLPQWRMGRRINERTNVTRHTVDLGASATAFVSPRISSTTSVGLQYNRRTRLTTAATGTNLPPGSETVTGSAGPNGREGRAESVIAGAYAQQQIGLNDRLYLIGAVRFDGGSSFGRDFRTAVYPKASASWLVSDEPFFPDVAALDNLRLRFAYGQAGVQPGTTAALDLISRFTSIVQGESTSGAALNRLGNTNLKPELQRELEAGVDIDLLDGRVSLEATYYNKLSTDALISEPLAASLGNLSRWVNVGSVKNWGYEGVLSFEVLRGGAVSWDVWFNGSVNDNRLEKLGIPGTTALGVSYSRHVEGYSLFGRWDRPIVAYDDANGNGVIEAGEVEVGDTAEYLGPSHPPRQLTASTAITLLEGRLRLSTQLDHRGGHLGFNASGMSHCLTIQSCRAVNDPDAPLTEQARAVAVSQYGTFAGYLQRASFTRWRELAVTYRLPAALAKRLGASDLTLTASGRNLMLWTDYSGVDPEVNSAPGVPDVEGNFGNPTAPQTRYWLLRLDARF